MSTATPTYDVFISHGARDREFATDVAHRLAAEGLQPFYDASIAIGEDVSKAIWDALAECRAFIVIVSPDSTPDAMRTVELGAATAWHKPIFVLLNGSASFRLPEALQQFQAYPRNRVDEVLPHIRQTFEPITDEDRKLLAELYSDIDIPADQLNQSPRELQELVNRFNVGSKRQLSGSRILSELLRMRKQSKLPRLGTRRRISKP